ncbi:MAG: acyl-CoA dehydrogenase family protein [Candidatus Hydrogenedentes bacterium]|nr:acyl-CoA dehydrogenase family protein [Candidatus Hydrogenedentota bacterium]
MKVDSEGKQKALDLAEESRETQWRFPSLVAELFRGTFRWDMLHPFPEQDEHDKRIGDEYIERVREVLEEYIDPDEVDRTQELPNDALVAMGDIGLFGLKIPKKYGGLEMSQTNYNRIMAFIATYCNSTAVWLSAHQSIGVPQPLKLFGTEEQKEKYLPRLAKGAVSGFALTEPDVGSDPARMTTTATPASDGSYYLLSGEKLWCTNGPSAEVLVVMALTPPKIVRGKERPQITAFIVESDMPGFEVAHRCSFMGIRGISNGLLRFDNVRVPAENIIGKPGQGLKIALTTLNTGRLTIPGTAAGGGKLCMHFARDWAQKREQWGAPVGKHQAVGSMLANMSANTFAMDCMNTIACAFVDKGQADIRLEAAMAKYFCTTFGWQIVDDLLQVRGGRGYETAQSLLERGEDPVPTERLFRDARISRIIEGTDEIMRLFIAREAMDTHVSRVMPIMMGKGPMVKLIWEAFKFYAGWYPRMWLPAGGGLPSRYLSYSNRRHLTYIAKAAKRLARTMFHTMARFGPKLEREQLILQRFVDIGTDLFAMACVLARTEHLLTADRANAALQDLADLFCRSARDRIADNLRAVKRNRGRLLNRVSKAFMDNQYEWLVEGVYTDFPPTMRRSVTRQAVDGEPPETPEPEDAEAPEEPAAETPEDALEEPADRGDEASIETS